MNKKRETIFALATPAGRSAIAIVRLSGSHAFDCIRKISLNMPKKENTTTLNKITSRDGTLLDQTITTTYKSPKSYTGEDMVEISIHGGAAVINKLIETLNSFKNLRTAEPGEFTRRAFENNKLDVTQVEAISDLVNSETEAQRKQSLNQLSGMFSSKIKNWSDRILKILSNIEAAIDFSDEDLPQNLISSNKEQIENIYVEINHYLNDNGIGEKIRSGFIVGILGNSNSGKSSFINAIAKRDIAIVTNKPGTTRDVIELFVDFKGFPVKFCDTAGIRKTSNEAENLGVEKSLNIAKTSDINLIFINSVKNIGDFNKIDKKIFIQSKIDINKKIYSKNKIFYISSKTGRGISILLNEIFNKILPNKGIQEACVSRERHRKILKNTSKMLKLSIKPKNVDMFAEDVRLSLNEISKISGKKDVEDILNLIFSDFCIGK